MSKNTPTISQIDGLIVRPSGPWIKKKYHYLKCYCDIFTKAMGKKWAPSALTFIDLFSGPGRCFIDQTKEDLEGSSLIALQYDFSNYIFVEKDVVSLNALKKRCQNSPKRSNMRFIEGDCNQVIDEVIKKAKAQGIYALGIYEST